MNLSAIQLQAFSAVARTSNFSSAAREIHLTQSALSQRVKNLETELSQTLFIRDPHGIRLTEAGERLLRYCRTKDALEEELVGDLGSERSTGLSGTLRIGAYSSVLRSVIVPTLAPLLRKNPKIQIDFKCREMRDLPVLLRQAEVDLIILDHVLEQNVLSTATLGIEEYVMIEGTRHVAPEDIYLDSDLADQTTEHFLKFNGKNPRYRRSFLGDGYSILDGVALGLGRAVMSRHLLDPRAPVRVVPRYKGYRLKVTLHFYTQPFYSQLHQIAVATLTHGCTRFLTK